MAASLHQRKVALLEETLSCHLLSIQHIQNQAIKIIACSPSHSNTSVLLHGYHILCIQKLFQYYLSLLFSRLPNNNLLMSFKGTDLLLTMVPQCLLLSGSLVLLCLRELEYGKQTLCFAAISLENNHRLNLLVICLR